MKRFNVFVPVKPYVKRFLEINYGDPVNFINHPREHDFLKRMLHKPDFLKDYMYHEEFQRLTTTVTVLISQNDFYRYGWQLSKSDTVRFGKHFEYQTKQLMRSIVGNYISFGIPLMMAIEMFQIRYHMEEEYWPFDAIKKDFYRFQQRHNISFKDFAFNHLENLILKTLADADIISNKGAFIPD